MHIWLTTPTSVAVGSLKIAPMCLACQQASYRRVTGSRGLCVGNRQEAYIADSAGVLSPGHKTVIGSKPGSFHRLPSSHDTNPERHARFRSRRSHPSHTTGRPPRRRRGSRAIYDLRSDKVSRAYLRRTSEGAIAAWQADSKKERREEGISATRCREEALNQTGI